MYDPYTDEGLRKLLFHVHTPRDEQPVEPKRLQWLQQCLGALYALYGYAPVAVLADLYNQREDYETTSIDVLRQVNHIPQAERDFTLAKGQIFANTLDPDELARLQAIPKRDYYLPDAEAISFSSLGVMAFTDKDTLKRAMHALTELTGIGGDGLFPLARAILDMISHDQPLEDITMAIAYFQKLTAPADQDRLRSILRWLDSRVPKLKYRGYTAQYWRKMT